MNTKIYNGDILDIEAEALVYSTNVMLNCTGGVGGALMMQFGPSIQHELHSILAQRKVNFADQGEVIPCPIRGIPYAAIFHTVPCDAFYRTTAEIIADILRQCLASCDAADNVRTIAMSALACGYGNFELDQLLRVASEVFQENQWSGIDAVTIAIPDHYAFKNALEQNDEERLGYAASS